MKSKIQLHLQEIMKISSKKHKKVIKMEKKDPEKVKDSTDNEYKLG